MAQLESDGLLRRTHGGAIRTQSGSFEPPLALRSRLNREAKRAIAAVMPNEEETPDEDEVEPGVEASEPVGEKPS